MGQMKKILGYFKEVRFSCMLIKYFSILFVALVLPVMGISGFYQCAQQKENQERMIEKNEESLHLVYSTVDSVIMSAKNIVYSVAHQQNVKYLATKYSIDDDEKAYFLEDIFGIIKKSYDYLDTVGIWFTKSDRLISARGIYSAYTYNDERLLELYRSTADNGIVYEVRKKNGIYPYVLTFLCPIGDSGENNFGASFINIDLERLGKYLGTGRYQTKDDSSTLLIFEKETGNLIYSDEYRSWQQEEKSTQELWTFLEEEGKCFSGITTLGKKKYIISTLTSDEGFLYVYLNPSVITNEGIMNGIYPKLLGISLVLCLIVAFFFALWIYRPIRKTVKLLDDFSMLVDWDEKNGVDEIESLQRSILKIKERSDSQDELLKERMLSLHNAQICALQTQINPHFLYNCLESIGNLTAIMMGNENCVTEALFTLGQLMRISLSGKNYLVSLGEELEHIRIYIRLQELIEPEFRKRVHLHVEIPDEMKRERIIKLTLQPILENALEHGLSGKRREGNIWISGERKDGRNYLYIMDDGVGVTKEQLEHLKENLKGFSFTSSRHIGLRNVNQRIKLVFGDEFGLSVEQTDRFIVTVVFKTV